MTPDPSGPRWDELLADAASIAEEYRENDWDAVVVEPEAVAPVEREERTGFDVRVSDAEYELVETLVHDGDVEITAAEVYYRPPEDGTEERRRVALAVERDEATETAVIVPLTYDVADARSVFERALREEELLVHVTMTDDPEKWISFSHDDPSLFLENPDEIEAGGESVVDEASSDATEADRDATDDELDG